MLQNQHRMGNDVRDAWSLRFLVMVLLSACGNDATPGTSGGDEASELSSSPAPPPSSGLPTRTTFAYSCADVYIVTQLTDDGSLWAFLPDQTVQLDHVPAASGTKYSDGTITFWSKGAEALLDVGIGDVRCIEDAVRSIVEDAKLRGVDFRGAGNEPPWILEIGPDSIVVYTGYESIRNAFPPVEPVADTKAASSTWRSTSSVGTSLLVTVYQPADGGRCQDSMADQTYESHVEIELGGQVLRGCGDPLH